MEKTSGFNIAIAKALEGLKDYFETHSLSITNNTEFFAEISKATIIKSYEFSMSLNQHEAEYMFFTLPALRGICEEYIVEKFLFEQFYDDMDRIVFLRHICDHYKSSIVQWKYFEVNRGDQILYYQTDFPQKLEAAGTELRNLIKKKVPNINKKSIFPSIHYMSKQTGVLELYNYLYHATSTFVHFNPTNLFRMGWGDIPNIKYTTANFKLYYKDFSIYYSVLLLSKLCEWQHANGLLPSFDFKHVDVLNDILQRAERCPEIVTFEEMNIGAFSKNLLYRSPNRAKVEEGLRD